MKRINEYSARFDDMKLDMTIFEIIKNMDKVVSSLVHYAIR